MYKHYRKVVFRDLEVMAFIIPRFLCGVLISGSRELGAVYLCIYNFH